MIKSFVLTLSGEQGDGGGPQEINLIQNGFDPCVDTDLTPRLFQTQFMTELNVDEGLMKHKTTNMDVELNDLKVSRNKQNT